MEFHSRMDLPRILNERDYRVGVEVGVFRGEFSERILRDWKGLLYLVDSWDGADDNLAITEATMSGVVGSEEGIKRWAIIRKPSIEARKMLCEMLDFVYIDADHRHQAVKADIEAWWPLISPGGILAGHDWVLDGWHIDGEPFIAHETRPQEHGCHEYGVRRAVAELQEPGGILHGLEMHVTPPEADDGWQSFLFIKPEEK